MNSIGKGIGLAGCAFAVALVAIALKSPVVCWAFLPIAMMGSDMWSNNKDD